MDTPADSGLISDRPAPGARRLVIAGLFAAVGWIAVCWLIADAHFNHNADQVLAEEKKQAEQLTDNIALGVRRNLIMLHGIPTTLARDKAIRQALQGFGFTPQPSPLAVEERKNRWSSDPQLSALNQTLAASAKDLGVSILWIGNAAGECIAASNAGTPGSTVGSRFTDREYFREVQAGRPGHQFAIGRTTNLPGLFFSSPVMVEGRFLGFVVAKVDMPLFSPWVDQADAFIADNYGVIVLAKDRGLDMRALPQAAVQKLSAEHRRNRYKRAAFPELLVAPWNDARHPELRRIGGGDLPMLLLSRAIPEDDLSVHVRRGIPQLRDLEQQRQTLFALTSAIGLMLIGSLAGILFYLRNIGDSRRALAESEIKLRAIIDAEPEWVKLLGPDGTLLHTNRAGLAMVDADTVNQVIGKSVFGMVAPSFRQAFMSLVDAVFSGESGNLEFETCGLKGSRRWLDIHSVPLRDSRGKIVALLGVTRDVTQRRNAEAALRQSEERFRMLTEETPIPLVMTRTTDDTVLYVNPRALELFRVPPGGGLGQSAPNFWVRPAERDAYKRDALAHGSVRDREVLLRDGNGREFWALLSGSITTWQGQGVLLTGIDDISRSKDAEIALRESENRLRTMADYTYDWEYWEGPNGEMLYVTPSCERITGYSREEFLAAPSLIYDIVHPEDRAVMRAHRDDSHHEDENAVDFRIVRKDGEIRWISHGCRSVYWQDQRFMGRRASNRDITERHSMQEELRKFARAVEQSANSVVITDVDGTIEFVNPRFCETTGYTTAEVLGLTPRILKSGETPEEEYRRLWQAIVAGQVWRGEFHNRRKDGTLYWESATIAPVKDESGRITHFLAVEEDISARKAAEESLRQLNETLEQRVAAEVASNLEKERMLVHQSRLAAMGEMIGNIAHQWRQPLNVLSLLFANLKDGYRFGEVDEAFVDRMAKEGSQVIQKMSATIDDFRNFFKPNKQMKPFLLCDATREALHFMEGSFRNRDIEITVEHCDQPCQVIGNPNEFSQVMLNALSNAKDAISARGTAGKIAISFGTDEDHAFVSIRDNGGGIAEEIIHKVFDPYFTTKAKGTGIGLYMSKMIVERMAGDLSIRNLGEGAELRISLPKDKQAGPSSQLASEV